MAIQLDTVKELKTAVITATVRNELHEPILGSALLTLTCEIFDKNTGTVIRPKASILGLTVSGGAAPAGDRINGGIIDETGLLNLRLDPADNPILGGSKKPEVHVVFIEWTWLDGGVPKYGGEELLLPVWNFDKLPV
jgi:hypothetical protein